MDTLGNPDNKIVTSNFGDYRTGHIHEGIDIPSQSNALQDSRYIWPIHRGVVVGRRKYVVTVRHYASNFGGPTVEGSRYIHANSDSVCEVGDTLELDDPVARGWDFEPSYEPHLHLEYRAYGGDTLVDSRNPFVVNTLQVADAMQPLLKHLYVDYSCHGDAVVENLNFLGYSFSKFFGDTTYQGITFKKLKLPAETPDDDLDDPHIMISGSRKVRFVLEAHDNFFAATDRGAPYILATFLDQYVPYYLTGKACFKLKFDSLLGATNEVPERKEV